MSIVMGPKYPVLGLSWNQSTDSYSRRIKQGQNFVDPTMYNLTLGSSPNEIFLPVHRQIKGCILNDSGSVVYYLDANDWTKKENGTDSNLTGADGQVMIEIPKFYFSHSFSGNIHTWDISLEQINGFSIHNAFIKDGVEVNHRYIGAYEGILYDTSAAIYTNGIYQPSFTCSFSSAAKSLTNTTMTNPFDVLEVGDKITISGTVSNNSTFTVAITGSQIIIVTEAIADETSNNTIVSNQRDYTATTGDKLSSVSGKTPITQLTRANARQLAKNRGSGWRQLDYDLVNALEILVLIEYATFYIQNISDLGPGITNVSGWSNYNNYNPFVKSGNGNSIGNASGDNAGSSTIAEEKTKYSKYRGIENFYGHIWKFVDGININNNIPYVTNNSVNWVDDTSTNYTNTNVTLANTNGYQVTLVNSDRVILPASIGGSSTTFITDYYYQSSGWHIAFFGGHADDGAACGFWYWALIFSIGASDRTIGSRLAF